MRNRDGQQRPTKNTLAGLLEEVRKALSLMENGSFKGELSTGEGTHGWSASVHVHRNGHVPFVQVAFYNGASVLQELYEDLRVEGYRFSNPPVDRVVRQPGLYFLNIYPKKK